MSSKQAVEFQRLLDKFQLICRDADDLQSELAGLKVKADELYNALSKFRHELGKKIVEEVGK